MRSRFQIDEQNQAVAVNILHVYSLVAMDFYVKKLMKKHKSVQFNCHGNKQKS